MNRGLSKKIIHSLLQDLCSAFSQQMQGLKFLILILHYMSFYKSCQKFELINKYKIFIYCSLQELKL